MPDVSGLPASYNGAPGFWIEERSVPTTKDEEEAACHPLSSSFLHVDVARELRSDQYSRNRAKNKVRFTRAQELKRQPGRPQRGHPAQRSKGGKRSGKRQPIPQDLATDSETDYDKNHPDLPACQEVALAPVGMREVRPISNPISPKLQPSTGKCPKGLTPPDAYTTATLPESTFNTPAPDTAREFRSYERHRHQTKKNARFTQSRKKKGTGAKPVLYRSSKSAKAENLQNLIHLTIADEPTPSEDGIRTPIEVPHSPDVKCAGSRAPPAVDIETLVTKAKVKYTKGSLKSLGSTMPPFLTYNNAEPGFEFVKHVLPVIALDDPAGEDDDEVWECVWNDDLVD